VGCEPVKSRYRSAIGVSPLLRQKQPVAFDMTIGWLWTDVIGPAFGSSRVFLSLFVFSDLDIPFCTACFASSRLY